MRRSLAVFAFLAWGTLFAGHAEARRVVPADTVVVADEDFLALHVIGAGYQRLRHHELPYVQGSGNIMADALGAGIAAVIVNNQMAIREQKRRDALLDPLAERLGRRGLQPLLVPLLRAPFTDGGTRRVVVAFGRGADLEPEIFQRIPAARGATRFVLVRKAAIARGPVGLPVGIAGGVLRLALDVEVREGGVEHNERTFRQQVVYELPVADGLEAAIARYAGDDTSMLAADLAQAMPAALALALDRSGAEPLSEGPQVGVIFDGRLRVHDGLLLAHADGRALIAAPGDVRLSVPADRVADPAELGDGEAPKGFEDAPDAEDAGPLRADPQTIDDLR